MGGSAGKAVDKVTEETNKVVKKSTGGAVDLGSTDIQSQAENVAADTGIQDLSDNLVAAADTVTKPFTDPIKKFAGDMANQMGLDSMLDQGMQQTSNLVSKADQKNMQSRLGLSELGQSMRSQQKKQFGRGQTARTLMTGKY